MRQINTLIKAANPTLAIPENAAASLPASPKAIELAPE